MMTWTKDKHCEECHGEYRGSDHDGDTCPTCRQMKALERIADVLEYWVGMQ